MDEDEPDSNILRLRFSLNPDPESAHSAYGPKAKKNFWSINKKKYNNNCTRIRTHALESF